MGDSGLIREGMGRREMDRSKEKAVVGFGVGGSDWGFDLYGAGGGTGYGERGGVVVIGGWDQLLGSQLEVWGMWGSAGGREVGWIEGRGDGKGRSG